MNRTASYSRMVYIMLLFFAAVILLPARASQAMDEVRFLVPDFPPYTFEKNGILCGIGIERFEQVMKEAGISYSVHMVSTYDRALMETKEGRADGFFLATRNAQRDAAAVMTDPLMMNNWCWFLKAKGLHEPGARHFKSWVRAGTILNTNTHKWLLENGYTVTGTPVSPHALIAMMRMDRVNAVFLSELVFFDALRESQEKPEHYRKFVQVEKPFGIYLAKHYLQKYPEVLDRINAAIQRVHQRK